MECENIIDKKPSNSEIYLMKIIWDAPGEVTLNYLADELREKYNKDYARTTIATFLKRLDEKGYIHQERRGRHTYITPRKSEKAYKEAMMLDTMNVWFKGDLVDMFSFIIRQDMFTKEDRDFVRNLLDKMSEENKRKAQEQNKENQQ